MPRAVLACLGLGLLSACDAVLGGGGRFAADADPPRAEDPRFADSATEPARVDAAAKAADRGCCAVADGARDGADGGAEDAASDVAGDSFALAPAQRTGLGVALPLGQPGNHRYSTTVTMTVILQKVDAPLVAVQWNNRVDLPTGNVGYSTGDGGEISVRVRKVAAIAAGKLTLGPVIGQTPHVKAPVNPASWNPHWQIAGGAGPASTRFRNFPTLALQAPVDLAAAGLAVGDPLAIEFVQHAAAAGTVSINVAHADHWAMGTVRAFSPAIADGRVFRPDGRERPEKVAMVLLGYADGVVHGNPWFGLAGSSAGDQFDIVGDHRIRQVIPNDRGGRSVKSLHAIVLRTTSSTAGDLVLELRAAANDGGAHDEGALLCEGAVPAASVSVGTNLKHHQSAIADLSVACAPPVPLVAGKTYYLVARADGGATSYRIQPMHRGFNQAEHGLKLATFITAGFRGQRDTGSGWSDIPGGSGSGPRNDAPLWMRFDQGGQNRPDTATEGGYLTTGSSTAELEQPPPGCRRAL